MVGDDCRGQLGERDRATHVACCARKNGMRHGREQLSRRKRVKLSVAIRAHANLQPTVASVELIAEIQQHGEQAVVDGRGGNGQFRPVRFAAEVGIV
jgi:hypothetical protein